MRSRLGLGWIVPPAAASLWLLAAPAAEAQMKVEQGHEIARTWCSGCHVVESGGASGSDVGPPFPVVAQDSSLTPDRLRAWLADPHPPMPNLSLSQDEIDALVAYIGSLRSQ